MNGECSCWCKYPNDAHKRGNGKWKCVDDYVCVKPLGKSSDGRRGYKTKCVKKELIRRESGMNNEEAIKHLQTYSTTNGSGQTTQAEHEEAKRMAIKALSQQIEIDEIEKRLETIMESDKRTMSNRFHDGEDGRYYDGYYDGIYAALGIVKGGKQA